MSVRRGGGLVAVATATPREDPAANEDAFAVLGGSAANVRGVALADGLGSYSHARLAAHAAVRGVEAASRALGRPSATGVRALFTAAHSAVRRAARAGPGGEAGPPAAQSFGTTLLVAFDTPAELWAAYVGNGAIWHVRGNFDGFPATTALPWCAVNLLSPHSVLCHGREVLYRLVDAAAEASPPSVVRLQPDPEFGDLLVVCTDGVYSADQLTQGTDVNGAVWISGEPPMVELFRTLRALFAEWDGKGEPELYRALAECLGRLRARGVLEDDATVGVIVTAAALDYHRRKRARATADATGARPHDLPPGESAELAAAGTAPNRGETAVGVAAPGEGASAPAAADGVPSHRTAGDGRAGAEASNGPERWDSAGEDDLPRAAADGKAGAGGAEGVRGEDGNENTGAADVDAGLTEDVECLESPTSPA